MAFVRVKVDGAKELDKALRGLDTAVATRIGIDAMKQTAKQAVKKFKAAAPYDPTYRLKTWITQSGQVGSNYYGHLRDNIVEYQPPSKQKHFIVFNITTSRAFWGYFQEFGTRKMPARPWARPAIEAMKDDLVRIQINLLGDGIKDYANKQGRINPNGRSG